VAVDIDPAPLARAEAPGVTTVCADVRAATEPADIIFAGNFSIGYMHTRADLVGYLRHVRGRLNPGGVFVCDTYGGQSAYTIGHVHRHTRAPDGRRIRYTWEQREADPCTGMVTDVLHFRLERGGVVEEELRDAFVYRWRLWSVPELRDAMAEAGFASTDIYDNLPDAAGEAGEVYVQPVHGPDLEASFIVCVAARITPRLP
jgi:hypothetical protein